MEEAGRRIIRVAGWPETLGRVVYRASSTMNNKVCNKYFKHDTILIYERLIWQITGAKYNN